MPDTALPAALWDALRQLEHSDRERVGIISAIAHAKHLAEHDDRLERARAATIEAERKVADLQELRRMTEDTIDDAKSRKLRAETRLASGRLQNSREIEAVQHEIATLGTLISDSETGWLQTSSDEETAQAALDAARASLNTEEVGARARRTRAEREVHDSEQRLSAIDAARREAAKLLPAGLRERYRQLYPSTGGHPFATAVAGECSHCHRAVPGEAMQLLRLGTGVPSCPSCSRLLLPP